MSPVAKVLLLTSLESPAVLCSCNKITHQRVFFSENQKLVNHGQKKVDENRTTKTGALHRIVNKCT